jgi:hypothetical protein
LAFATEAKQKGSSCLAKAFAAGGLIQPGDQELFHDLEKSLWLAIAAPINQAGMA